MEISSFKIQNRKIFFCILHFAFCALFVNAQSTNSEYPTPITSNEISGIIRARDIGDARLTSYYYVFNGSQGDVFINVETTNLNGDIDVFAAEGLRPLSKIALYADSSQRETGRIIYLRQPLKLILRVEGRTPDDNPATFRIKFAGSFAAYQGGAETNEPEMPKVQSEEQGSVKVNSVGTIIEEKKEKATTEKEKAADIEQPDKEPDSAKENPPKAAAADETAGEKKNESDNEKISKTESSARKIKPTVNKNKRTVRRKTAKTGTAEPTDEAKTSPPANSLENVRLIVLMKNGDKFEYPMTEVFRFSLNNNILTIILKNGKIERRSIFDIQKFSVE